MRPFGHALVLSGALALAGVYGQAADLTSIAIATPEPGADFGWNQQGIAGAQAAADKHHLKLVRAEGLGYGDIRPTLRDLADQGVGLIIAHASGFNTAAVEIGSETHVPVAITDRPDLRKPGAVADFTLSGHEGAFLAGRLAARMTRTGVLGIVVSAEVPDWNAQSGGFIQGARSLQPDIVFRYAVIGPAAYADAAGGRRVTASVIAAGADVILGQGDGSSFGMIQAVETSRPPPGADTVWFIDVIGDKSSLDRGHLLSSVVWNFAPVFDALIQGVKAGTFGAPGYRANLTDGSIALLHTKHIPDAIWAELERDRQDVIDGRVPVAEVLDTQRLHDLLSK